MLVSDLAYVFFVYMQPPFLGFLVFNFTRTRVGAAALFTRWGGSKRR